MTNHCPNCGNADVSQKTINEVIPYGAGTNMAEIAVDLPIRHCNACGEEWEDADSFRVKHAAVCAHLGRLTPSEVVRVRTEIGSRERFSELTGIGPASLARWESGALIQNAAYDLLLRAVADVAIRERLFALRTSNEEAVNPRALMPAAATLAGSATTTVATRPNVIPFRGRVLTGAEAVEKRIAAQQFSFAVRRPIRGAPERVRA